jgi:hypothetical protein
MSQVESYRHALRAIEGWDAFLLKESGLPGARANLELAQAVAEEGNQELFERFLRYDADQAPTDSRYEFLAFCGVVGLGRLAAEGKKKFLVRLRACASDPRWRIREAVAIALQRLGDVNMDLLLEEMKKWSKGNWREKRAAAAAVCEPRLLKDKRQVKGVLQMLDEITASLARNENRKSDEFEALKKGLGYCWSVAVAAFPEQGKRRMEKWFASDDKDVRWVMRENLKKARLARMDAAWVKKAQRTSFDNRSGAD